MSFALSPCNTVGVLDDLQCASMEEHGATVSTISALRDAERVLAEHGVELKEVTRALAEHDYTHGMNDDFVESLLAQVSRMQGKGFSNEAIMLALISLAGDE